MKIKRRRFLKQSALGVGGMLVGPQFAPAAEHTSKRFDPYATITLGKTNLKFSRVCLGTGMRGGNRESNQTRMGKDKFEALIRGSYERGVRLFDLADLYGTHPYLLPALEAFPAIIMRSSPRSGGIRAVSPKKNARMPMSSSRDF